MGLTPRQEHFRRLIRIVRDLMVGATGVLAGVALNSDVGYTALLIFRIVAVMALFTFGLHLFVVYWERPHNEGCPGEEQRI